HHRLIRGHNTYFPVCRPTENGDFSQSRARQSPRSPPAGAKRSPRVDSNGRNPYRQIRIVSPILYCVAMSINVLAVISAALCSFLVGGPWYSDALFKKMWMRAAGVNAAALEPGSKQQKHPAYVFGVSFVFALIAAFVFALWLGPNPPLGYAVGRCLLA